MEITLRNTDGHDGLPERKLTITARQSVNVGRSSKTGTRNVVPAVDNAFIDSPVISREHAVLSLKSGQDEPALFIKDTGSMHGTFVDEKKLEANVLHRLRNGSIIQFGALVHRNNETFPARKYQVEIGPLSSPTSQDKAAVYEVPYESVSEDESSQDESDAESDSFSSYPLKPRANNAETQTKFRDYWDTRDVRGIPDNVIVIEDDSPVDPSQASKRPELKDNYDDLYEPGPRIDTPQKQSQVLAPSLKGASFSPIRDADPDANADARSAGTGYPDALDSHSISSSSSGSGSDTSDDDEDFAEHGIDEELLALDGDHASSAFDTESVRLDDDSDEEAPEVESSKPPANSCRGLGASFTVAAQQSGESIDNEQFDTMFKDASKPFLSEEATPRPNSPTKSGAKEETVIPINDLVQTATPNDTQGKNRLAQSMSLDRIIDSPSKDAAASSNGAFPASLARPALGGRADAVPLRSLLNSTPDANSAQLSDYRIWKSATGMPQNQSPGLTTPSIRQPSVRNDLSWENAYLSPSFDGVMDDSTVMSQGFNHYRTGPFAFDYSSQHLTGPESNVNVFDVPDMEPSSLPTSYCPGEESGAKELPKAKSISISDIVDKSPIACASNSGQKRKAEVLEEDELVNTSEADNITSDQMKFVMQSSEPNVDASTSPPAQSVAAASEAPARPRKQRRLHIGSMILGAAMGGVGMFSALVWVPDRVWGL